MSTTRPGKEARMTPASAFEDELAQMIDPVRGDDLLDGRRVPATRSRPSAGDE